MTRNGRMTQHELRKVEAAKKNGSWNRIDSVEIRMVTPYDLQKALKKNRAARRVFESFAPSRKKEFLWWIHSAKRQEPKTRRINETIRMLLQE